MLSGATESGAYWKRQDGHGFAGANLLTFGGNPRAMGMGEAYAAAGDDIGAIEYNPAGLGLLRHPQWRMWGGWQYAGFDILRNNVAYAQPIPYLGGALAASFTYVAYGMGGVQDILDDEAHVVGKFTPRDNLYTLGYGRRVRYGIHLGMQLKYFAQVFKLKYASGTAGGDTQKAWLADFGLVWRVPQAGGLRLAWAFQNTGESVGDYLPPDSVRIGLAYPVPGKFFESSPLTLTYDLSWPVDSGRVSCGGLEFFLARSLALRVGYNLPLGYGYTKNTGAGHREPLEGLRWGIGLGDEYFRLDYAFLYKEDLGDSHFLSATVTFGSDKKKAPEKKVVEQPQATTEHYIQPGSSPFNLTAKAGNQWVELSWEPAYATNVQGFNIYRRQADGQRIKLTKLPLKKNRCALRGLRNGKEYQFAVSIVFNDFEETFTPFINAVPFSILEQEQAAKRFADLVPADFQAEVRGAKLVLSWTKLRDARVAGTYINWRKAADEEYKRLNQQPIKSRTMALSGLISGTYYFTAQSTDGGAGEAEQLSRPSAEIVVEYLTPEDRQKLAAQQAAAAPADEAAPAAAETAGATTATAAEGTGAAGDMEQ